jgi:CheY-like chemotaxis protein
VRAHKKGLEVVCHVATDVPAPLIGDPTQLGQILSNLLSNAIKFTARGEVAVSVTCAAPPVESHVALTFAVRDTGIGIPADRQTLIFEAFRQSDGSTTRQYGGTGLGLSICQQLVGLMGGHLQVTSEPDKGSTFEFTVDLKISATATATPIGSAVLSGQTALVIDDNAASRAALADLLHSWGLMVTEANSALVGLQEIDRARDGRPFNFILLDSRMPRMDGFTAAGWFRDDAAIREYVIMLLMTDQPDDIARCREVGLTTYVNKPIKSADLRAALGRIQPAIFAVDRAAVSSVPATTAPVVAQRSLRILLADDNAVGLLVGRKMLEEMGHQVHVAKDGLQVLQQFEQNTFDVILMDIEMPHMDGLETTRRIRQQERTAGHGRSPILAVTAYASGTNRTQCLAAGMDGYLSKPFTPDKLNEALVPLLAEAAPPAFNLETALKAVGGRGEFIDQVVQVFMEEDYTRHLTELKAGLAASQPQRVRAAAHGLKGALLSLGGEAAAALAEELQLRAEDKDLTPAPALIAQLIDEVVRFSETVKVGQPTAGQAEARP